MTVEKFLPEQYYHHEDPSALTPRAQNEYARRERHMDNGEGPKPSQPDTQLPQEPTRVRPGDINGPVIDNETGLPISPASETAERSPKEETQEILDQRVRESLGEFLRDRGHSIDDEYPGALRDLTEEQLRQIERFARDADGNALLGTGDFIRRIDNLLAQKEAEAQAASGGAGGTGGKGPDKGTPGGTGSGDGGDGQPPDGEANPNPEPQPEGKLSMEGIYPGSALEQVLQGIQTRLDAEAKLEGREPGEKLLTDSSVSVDLLEKWKEQILDSIEGQAPHGANLEAGVENAKRIQAVIDAKQQQAIEEAKKIREGMRKVQEATQKPFRKQPEELQAYDPHTDPILNPDEATYVNIPEAQNFLRDLHSIASILESNENYILLVRQLEENQKEVINLLNSGKIDQEQALHLLDSLRTWEEKIMQEKKEEIRRQQEEGEGAQGNLYITSREAKQLREDPTKWLNDKFNAIYADSQSGQPSALIGLFQNQLGYIDLYVGSEVGIRMRQEFHNRIGLLGMRLAIESKKMDQVAGSAAQLLARGFLSPMGYEGGRVGALFHRMQDKLDDRRLADGGSEKHVTPEFLATFQQELIDEQLELAKNGAGLWGYEKDNLGRARVDITRTVRTAYDAFVVSQRQALIVSRGRHLSGAEAFFSDPIGAFGNVYNIEDLATGKFGIFNADQVEFLDEIKLELAEDNMRARGLTLKPPQNAEERLERIELGTALFKDMYAVPDFFSSGWRMLGITNQLNKLMTYTVARTRVVEGKFSALSQDVRNVRYAAIKEEVGHDMPVDQLEELLKQQLTKELTIDEKQKVRELMQTDVVKNEGTAKAEEFGLFIRLQQATKKTGTDRETAMDIAWQKIRDFHAEEIIRLYRDRSPEELNGLVQEFADQGFTSVNGKTITDGISAYDLFKAKYGAVMRSVRDTKLAEFRQLHFGRLNDANGLTAAEKLDRDFVVQQFDRALGEGEGEKFLQLYAKMQQYVDNQGLIYGLIGKSKASIDAAKGRFQAKKSELEALYPDTPEGNEARRKALHEWNKEYVRAYEAYLSTEEGAHDRALRHGLNKFEGVYTRVLMVDDALLGDLEAPSEDAGLTALSKVYSTDFAGDALVRNMNDTVNADKAGIALRDFIIAEDPKEKAKKAEEFAGSVGAYNGTLPKAQALRFTFGTYEEIGASPLIMDVIGLRKLPFRIPSTKLEKIFGPQAQPKSTDERRSVLDQLKSALTGNMSELSEEQKRLPAEEQEQIIRENKEAAERWYFDLEKKLRARRGDIISLKILQLLVFLVLAAGGEAVKLPGDAFQQTMQGK